MICGSIFPDSILPTRSAPYDASSITSRSWIRSCTAALSGEPTGCARPLCVQERMIARHMSGWVAPKTCASIPPIEWPIITALPVPRLEISAATSSAIATIPPSTNCDPPKPGASMATTVWLVKWANWQAQLLLLPLNPCRNTKAGRSLFSICG